jgi:glycosyltransferase involved in cell wall biosynthesis
LPHEDEHHLQPQRKPVELSVVFPAYNDAGTIPSMVIGARLAARRLADDYEIIVVNDGSRDHTADVLAELESVFPELRVIHHPVNRGYGGALRSGFQAATKDLIFYTDGDAQYDPREMERLFAVWEESSDFVNGSKIGRSDPLHRAIIGRIYHWFVRVSFGLRLSDVDCDFRLFRRRIFEKVELTKSSGVICVELMKKVQDNGFRVQEVPVHHFHRVYGRSQFFNFPRVAKTLLDLARLWFDLVVYKVHLTTEQPSLDTTVSKRARPIGDGEPAPPVEEAVSSGVSRDRERIAR